MTEQTQTNRSLRALVFTFGILAALVGAYQGVGALRRGNTEPEAPVFQSWPESPVFEDLAGGPALTVIPNLFGAGAMTILVAITILSWLLISVHRKGGWIGLLVLVVTFAAVGGGFGPSAVLLVLCAGAAQIRHPLAWWRARSERLRRVLSALFPLGFALSLVGLLGLVPGLFLLRQFADFQYEPAVFIAAGLVLFGLILSIVTAAARDSLVELSEDLPPDRQSPRAR